MKFSVIVPARDEENHIGACLESVRAAADSCDGEAETVVVLNRCTNATEAIARTHGVDGPSDQGYLQVEHQLCLVSEAPRPLEAG